MGRKRYFNYDEEEDAVIMDAIAKGCGYAEISKILTRRSPASIKQRLNTLKKHKPIIKEDKEDLETQVENQIRGEIIRKFKMSIEFRITHVMRERNIAIQTIQHLDEEITQLQKLSRQFRVHSSY